MSASIARIFALEADVFIKVDSSSPDKLIRNDSYLISKCVLTNLSICIDMVEKIDIAFEKWCAMRVNRSKILQDISDMKSGVVVGYKFSVGKQVDDSGNIASDKQVIFVYLSR